MHDASRRAGLSVTVPRVRPAFDDLELRSTHLHMRIGPGALARLRAAAHLRQQDVTSFVLGAALDRAWEVLDREERLETAQRLGRPRPAPGAAPSDTPSGTAYDQAGGAAYDGADDAELDQFPDPDDPDIDLWNDYRVTREPPSMRMVLFRVLKTWRQRERDRGDPPQPARLSPW